MYLKKSLWKALLPNLLSIQQESAQNFGGSAFEVVWNYCAQGFGLDNSTGLGQLIYTAQLSSGNHPLNITEEASGVYFLRVQHGNTSQTTKIIKE